MTKMPDIRAECESCGLHLTCKSPLMRASGSRNPKVLVVGEAPGELEDEQGVPFIGKSGKLLREVLDEFFNVKLEVSFTNVVRCRPPENKITKKAVSCCRGHLLEEIEELNPGLVLLMGNVPLNAVLGESGITTWNGVVIERKGRVYVPLFHPAFILRNESAMDDWLNGMCAAEEAMVKGNDRADSGYEYIYPLTVEEVLSMRDYLAKHKWISYDVETTNLDPHSSEAKLVAVSFATTDKAFAVPMSWHAEFQWTPKELKAVSEIVVDILRSHDGRIIGHNLKFDQKYTYSCLGYWFSIGSDTMLISHLLDSRSGIHGLKRLAGLYLGMYDYEKGLIDYRKLHVEADPYRGGSYANIPLEILLPYAAMDASATFMLNSLLFDKLSDSQRILYREIVLRVSDAVSRMEYAGASIDRWVAGRYHNIYGIVMSERLEELSDDKYVRRLVRDRQRALDEENKSHPNRRPKKFTFNPNSHVQLRALYYDYARVPEPDDRTTSGLPTTSYGAIKALASEHPIISKVRAYTLLGDMLSKYIGPAAEGSWESDDGKVHANYNLHGTVTGRLSSDKPNMQNIPTPEKEPGTLLASLPIKNLFTHSYWNREESKGYVVSADYAGMELRVFASLANCKAMLEIHKSEVDFHTMVASMISGLPYDKITKPIRYVYKWTNWTMLYGGGAWTLHFMYNIPMKDAEAAVATYHEKFPEVLDYHEYLVKFAKEHGYVESPFGRRAYYPYINDKDPKKVARERRRIVNMPVQSAAGEITLIAVVLIDMALRDKGLAAHIINTVHDSIVLDVPEHEIDEVASICTSTMENVADLTLFYMPGIDMSWLKCPLKADVEIGTHYGALEKYVNPHTIIK